MIYRKNLKVLQALKPGVLLTCDSLYNIRFNISSVATWYRPPASLNEAIRRSFEHYFNLIEMFHNPHFEQQSETHIPNLRDSLTNLVTLAETYQTTKMGTELVESVITLHNVLNEKLAQLEHKYPDFFVNNIEKTLSLDECHEQLKNIETSLASMLINSDESSTKYVKAKKLLHYVSVMKETLKKCCYTLNEKALNLYYAIVKFFAALCRSKTNEQVEEDLITSLGYVGMSGDEDDSEVSNTSSDNELSEEPTNSDLTQDEK